MSVGSEYFSSPTLKYLIIHSCQNENYKKNNILPQELKRNGRMKRNSESCQTDKNNTQRIMGGTLDFAYRI